MKLKETLRSVLGSEDCKRLIGSYDIVGSVAIIIIAPELSAKELLIAQAIFQANKRVRTVAKRVGVYEGEYRTIGLEVIGGEPIGETEHRENGVRLILDPARVYFSVRSSTERKRISQLIGSGEEVLVMFSGVGAYPLVIAANSSVGSIVGIEKNPEAHRFAVKSLAANRRISNVTLYQGDVDEVVPGLHCTFDRILMPLPKTAGNFLALALPALRPGGWLHFYDFKSKQEADQSVAVLRQACLNGGRCLEDYRIVACGHVAPRIHRICVDALIR